MPEGIHNAGCFDHKMNDGFLAFMGYRGQDIYNSCSPFFNDITVMSEKIGNRTSQMMCYIPVSYTHLDVYKRQVGEKASSRGMPALLKITGHPFSLFSI